MPFTHIIAIRILNKSQCIVSDLIDKLDPLMIRCMIDATLQYTASMTVRSHLDTVSSHSIVNELGVDPVSVQHYAHMTTYSPDYLRVPTC